MTTQTQMLGTPRDDLAAAQLGIEPVPERQRVLGFLDYSSSGPTSASGCAY